ncbi:MAG: DNA translocase FtsK [Candidatus Shapirobacteria bacterium]|jgi:DNA segregation ATPase FtsK/SpoIIIE-like protein
MTDIQNLQQKIANLEERLKVVEARLGATSSNQDSQLMDELYQKSRFLVVRYQKASAIFLQKKLLIDYPRASQLIIRLEEEGVISSPKSDHSRDILVTK